MLEQIPRDTRKSEEEIFLQLRFNSWAIILYSRWQVEGGLDVREHEVRLVKYGVILI